MQDISLDGGMVFYQWILCRPGIGFGPIHQQIGGIAIGTFKHPKETGILHNSFIMFRP